MRATEGKDTGQGRVTHAQAYVALVAALAGLVHDIGKASSDFVAKLAAAASAQDRLRHELLGVAAFLAALDRGIPTTLAPDDRDVAVLRFLANGFLDAVDDILAESGKATRPMLEAWLSGARPFMHGIEARHGRVAAHACLLVATHHRLCSSTVDARNTVTANVLTFVRNAERAALAPGPRGDGKAFREAVAAAADGASFAGGLDRFGTPGEVLALRAAFEGPRGVPGRLLDLLGEAGGIPATDAVVAHHGRIALMLGDHHVSATASASRAGPRKRGLLYANRPRDPGRLWGQRLAPHLLGVSRAAQVAGLAMARRGDAFPALSGDALPESVTGRPSADPRYAWQSRAVAMVADARRDRGAGFLCLMAASTGTGKTRAVPAVLLAASGGRGLRYSVGLGLRSLTLQTADEHVRRLGFHPGTVGVAVGSALARGLARLRAGEGGDGLAQGSDAEPEDTGAVVSREPLPGLPPVAGAMNRDRTRDGRGQVADADGDGARRFLAAPVLVSTLDQLMPVATSTRGGFLVPALRTATADLAIDELDDFQPEDVAAICRLVEHAAAFGRSVCVSSATLPPPVAAAVFDAYATGRRMHAAWSGAPAATDVAWIHEGPQAVRRISHAETLGTEAFGAAHDAFSGDVVASIRGTHPGRRLAVLAGPMGEDPHEAVARAVRALHGAHHAVDPATGLRVSAGVVRLANVRPAVRAAHRLATDGEADGVPVVVVPYTGSLLPAVRHHVEAALDRCLTRHGADDPLLVPGSPLRAHVDRHAAAGARDLALVVVTTSLEEVGRDHDFDWAVTEPVSERALVQLAGRVRRHRPPLPPGAPANVSMLPAPLRAAGGAERPFARPGVQDRWLNAHGDEPLDWRLPSSMAADLFAGDGFEGRIDAVPVVGPDLPASPMAAYGRRRWEAFLREGAGDGITPASRADPRFPRHCDAHQAARRFRRQAGHEKTYVLTETGWREPDGRGGDQPAETRFTALADVPDGSLLVPFGEGETLAAARELAARLAGDDPGSLLAELLTLTVRTHEGAPELSWHPSFGAFIAEGP